MKSGMSSLNPYATSYIPVSKREVTDGPKVHDLAANDMTCSKKAISSAPSSGPISQNHYQNEASYGYASHDSKEFPPELFMGKNHPIPGYHVSSSKNNEVAEKQVQDELFEMDLAYLQMTFPGLSEQSLADVYLVNECDLDASIDMLSQLESYNAESYENYPGNTIHGVSNSGSSSVSATLKLKELAGEASSSSAGSIDAASPS